MVPSAPVILLAIPFLACVAACGKSAEFRHAAHVAVTEGECAPCHGSDPAAPRAALDADCAACHGQAKDPSARGSGRYRVREGRSASARRPAYGGMTFRHAPHAAAGIPCAECHAAAKWRGNSFVLPNAEECAACHSGTSQTGGGHPGEGGPPPANPSGFSRKY